MNIIECVLFVIAILAAIWGWFESFSSPFFWELCICLAVFSLIFFVFKNDFPKMRNVTTIISLIALAISFWTVATSISSLIENDEKNKIQKRINKPKFQTTLTDPWKVENNNINYPIWKLTNYGESRVSIESISNKFFLTSVMRINYLMAKSYIIHSETYAPIVIPLPSMSESISTLSGNTTGTLAIVNRVNMVSNLSKGDWDNFQKEFEDVGKDSKGLSDSPSINVNGQIYKPTPAKVIRIKQSNGEPGNVTSIDVPQDWGILCKTNIKYRVDGGEIKSKSLLSSTDNGLWDYEVNRDFSISALDQLYNDAKKVPSLRYYSKDSYFNIAIDQIRQAAAQNQLSRFSWYFEKNFGNNSENIRNARSVFSSDKSKVIGIQESGVSGTVSSIDDKYPHSVPYITTKKDK
ncbi:hypothetical protein ACFQAV_07765 [Companilactobacillus huachuanensis]|uniref:Uncharacterized protein n=1 Tax=Companilactobacillus huachuanensis TaxID=2559914 RepID=A0ABW1RPF4_9LACO|nr:hypothetical protein [Companilactobacillus huachuanensis]